MQDKLNKRKHLNNLRRLELWPDNALDFCSNDYLGIAQSKSINSELANLIATSPRILGASGSRLISGNNELVEECEEICANMFAVETSLLFSNGFTANLGLIASISSPDDVILCDQDAHASLKQGCRLASAKTFFFRHNDVNHLAERLRHFRQRSQIKNIFIVCESLYSMDGSIAPLVAIIECARRWDAKVIVDEAHGFGTYGPKGMGVVQGLGVDSQVLARIVTLGKAIGFHGAFVVGSHQLRELLVNFAVSFIYSTALPYSSLLIIKNLLKKYQQGEFLPQISDLHVRVESINRALGVNRPYSPIYAFYGKSLEHIKEVAASAFEMGFMLKAIVSPTVQRGSERVRLAVHCFNEEAHIARCLKEVLGGLWIKDCDYL